MQEISVNAAKNLGVPRTETGNIKLSVEREIMKRELQHTPTPWTLGDFDWRVIVGADTRFKTQLEDSGRRETDGSPLISASNSLSAIAIIEESSNLQEDLANARYIVTAVNSHERLIEALRELLEAQVYADGEGLVNVSDAETANKARAALQLAEAGAVEPV